ncbi:MAG TPA: DUF4230 domain-containing protein [Actinophytocola sp.]|uniref:DUF4230 domain-containing protein n=1 Tax=Actinophytocola sp. TaxID=1872138 RepID=UPI002F955D57
MPDTPMSPLWKVGRVVGVVVVIVAAVLFLAGKLPSLNPFHDNEVDRSQPALLQSVKDLSEYHAAQGNFQVVVDLEHDVAWVPDVIAGSRTLFVAAGSVDAYVDFDALDERALKVDTEKRTVRVQLPAAKLAKPSIDQKKTYLYSQERGVWDRVSALFKTEDQQEFYVMAEKKISDAAKDAGLTARAEKNTRTMLTGMFKSLGYTAQFPEDSAS